MIKKEFLFSIPIFKLLPDVDHLPLVSLWKEKNVKAGEVLFRKGQAGSSMFVIENGEIEIILPVDPPVNEVLLSVLKQGEFFGELSLLADTPRTATARAVTDTRLVEMQRDDYIAFVMERPSVGISMLSEMAKRLQLTNDLITSLTSKNPNEEIKEKLSFGDKIADKIAEFGGSWRFIIAFGIFMACWIGLNSVQLIAQPFDEYPFILLNLMLSTVAALQAPVIMMSQNRAQKKDRLKADLDYQVNIKSELMLQQLHQKMDRLMNEEISIVHKDLELLKKSPSPKRRIKT